MTDPVSKGLPFFRLVETEIGQHHLPLVHTPYKKVILKSNEHLQIIYKLFTKFWCALSAVNLVTVGRRRLELLSK